MRYLCSEAGLARQCGRRAERRCRTWWPLLKDRDENVRLGSREAARFAAQSDEAGSEVGHLLSDASQEVAETGGAALCRASATGQQVGRAARPLLAKEGFEDVRREIENAVRRLEK